MRRTPSDNAIETTKPCDADNEITADETMDKVKVAACSTVACQLNPRTQSNQVDDLALQLASLPPLADVVTVRAIFVGLALGFLFAIITLKLALTVGVIPSLNIGAGSRVSLMWPHTPRTPGLLGFCCLRGWTFALSKIGLTAPRRPENTSGFWGLLRSRAGWWYLFRCAGPSVKPFTRQENTVIQTFVVAAYGTAFTGGFGSYLLSLDQQTYENLGSTNEANSAADVFQPTPARTYTFTLCTAAVGVFAVLILRKIFILKYRLPYPSGHATGVLINSFHTEAGSKLAIQYVSLRSTMVFHQQPQAGQNDGLLVCAQLCMGAVYVVFLSHCCRRRHRMQVRGMLPLCTTTHTDHSGGFGSFPTFGLTAYAWTFYFDFNLSYVGAGLISPHVANLSMLFGAILSYGIMWPLLANREGDWYPAGLHASDPR